MSDDTTSPAAVILPSTVLAAMATVDWTRGYDLLMNLLTAIQVVAGESADAYETDHDLAAFCMTALLLGLPDTLELPCVSYPADEAAVQSASDLLTVLESWQSRVSAEVLEKLPEIIAVIAKATPTLDMDKMYLQRVRKSELARLAHMGKQLGNVKHVMTALIIGALEVALIDLDGRGIDDRDDLLLTALLDGQKQLTREDFLECNGNMVSALQLVISRVGMQFAN